MLSRMDIAERRKPQDGSFTLKVSGEDVDFRVASMDTSHGEKVVMRILIKSISVFSLADLGFQPESLQVYNQLLDSPFGMVLVSGPTGSGKPTTLYASLLRRDSISKNIMTIEDPIEYHFPGVSQTQVNEQAGVTFASGLRGLLRLDPDFMLVGEIRDHETASVAAQSALTGHLVLTPIHANDAAAAITRLIDLDVEPFLVTSAVIGSVAQRLVRKLCEYCKTPSAVTPTEVAAYQMEMNEMVTQFYVGRGCNMCSPLRVLRQNRRCRGDGHDRQHTDHGQPRSARFGDPGGGDTGRHDDNAARWHAEGQRRPHDSRRGHAQCLHHFLGHP